MMTKQEILRGMKMSRKVNDYLADKKYVLKSELGSDTSVTPVSDGGGLSFVISDTKPEGTNILWLDTSKYEAGE